MVYYLTSGVFFYAKRSTKQTICQRDIESPLTTIRAYTEALLEGVAPDEAARQRYLQTIYARETDL